MAKSDPLYKYLRDSGEPVVQLSFQEISDMVGGLPKSASKYQAWWANEKDGPYVRAYSSMKAGYHVDSFIFDSYINFVRT